MRAPADMLSREQRIINPARIVAALAVVAIPLLLPPSSRAQTLPPVPGTSAAAAEEFAPVPEQPGAAAQVGPGAQTGPLVPPPSTYVMPSVAVLATQTNDANAGTGASPHADTVLDVIPRVFLQSRHARWQLQADLGLHAAYYVQGTNPDTLTPQGNATLHSEWVRKLLYLDAGFASLQGSATPFIGQGGALQSSRYTTTQWHLSPYIDRTLRPGLRLVARSDDTWTRTSNVPGAYVISGGRYLNQSLVLEQMPNRLGYTVQAGQTYATYDGVADAWLRDTTLRVIGNAAVAAHAVFGLIAGDERVQGVNSDTRSSIYGFRLALQPGLYAKLGATVEHRYFGTGWDATFSGGTAQSRLSLAWQRAAASGVAPLGSTASLSGVDPATNIGELLNSLLFTKYPDPLERARAVQSLLGGSGLPAGLATSGQFYVSSTVVQNRLALTGLLLRGRNSAAVSVYRSRVEDLYLPGQQVLSLLNRSNDTLQSGWALNLGRRLTPLANLNLTLQAETITGFGPNQGLSARSRVMIVQLDRRLLPRTTGLVGVRRRLLASTQVAGGNETGVFAGFVHRF